MGKSYGPLRGVIVARYGSLRAYANAKGKKPNAVQRTLEPGYRWKVDEAIEVSEDLGIPIDQIGIFFINQG